MMRVKTTLKRKKRKTYSSRLDIVLVLRGGVRRDLHILEHSFHLLGKLEAAFDLELGQHASLGII